MNKKGYKIGGEPPVALIAGITIIVLVIIMDFKISSFWNIVIPIIVITIGTAILYKIIEYIIITIAEDKIKKLNKNKK